MRFLLAGLGFLIITGVIAVTVLPAKERGIGRPIAWCYVREGPLEVTRRGVGLKSISLSLSRGVLAPVLRMESKKGSKRALLRLTDLATLLPVEGWVDASQTEVYAADRFPADEELVRRAGMENLDDLTIAKVSVSRWLVKQGKSDPALICFLGLFGLPASRLVAFLPLHGDFIRGPYLEFPFSEMKPGIVWGEVRDLLGDGNECFITREPFREGPATFGVNMVIRRLEGGQLAPLWMAPLEFQNFSFYPREVQILRPLEKNAGAPGTLTKAEVEFQQRGSILIPVWKATVGFFALGQDKPTDSVKVTKVCAWNGSQFEPVR
jgi:hypothetical protein